MKYNVVIEGIGQSFYFSSLKKEFLYIGLWFKNLWPKPTKFGENITNFL